MKITPHKQLEINNIAGEFESTQANIDNSSLPFVFEMLSKSFYSDPIGSIIREITSNCFDSHVEANINDAVIIKHSTDDVGAYISFIDFGVGLSPERVKSIYMNYFSSTKRDTNNQIGGFGLGSKSPFAYTDVFYINTVYNNIKYEYVFSKGETIPTLDLVLSKKTNERNGTEIKIYLENSNDYSQFQNAIKNQLLYFDNVYYDGFYGIYNQYTIFEADSFKIRDTNCQFPIFDKAYIHVVLGKVAYPINYDLIGIPKLKIPIALKFNIGDLDVTPNRETLRYTEKTIKALTLKYNEFQNEIVKIFDKQNSSFDSFVEYIKNNMDKSRVHIKLKYPNSNEMLKVYIPGNFELIHKRSVYKHTINLNLDSCETLVNIIYPFLVDLGAYGKTTKNGYSISNMIYRNNYNIVISNTKHTSLDKNWLHSNNVVFYERTTKEIVAHILNDYKYIISISYTSDYYDELGSYKRSVHKSFPILNWSKLLYTAIKEIKKEITSISKGYYKELTPEELIGYRDFKRQNDKAYERKINQVIHIKHVQNGKTEDVKIDGLVKSNRLIIYGFREDTEKLKKILTILSIIRPNYFRDNDVTTLITNYAKVILINKQMIKFVKNQKNICYVDDFYSDNRLFRILATKLKIKKFFGIKTYGTINFVNAYKNINKSVGESLVKLIEYAKSTDNSFNVFENADLTEDDINAILEIADRDNLYDPNIMIIFNDVLNYFKDVEILRYVYYDKSTIPYVLKTLYNAKKKLDIEYYQTIMNNQSHKQLKIDFDSLPKLTKFNIQTSNII